MTQSNQAPRCATCEKLAVLVEQAGLLQMHDSRLETLLSEVESLIGMGGPAIGASSGESCGGHLTQLQALLPRLQKLYETMLVERHELNQSISELDLLRSWSQQWSSGTEQPSHSLRA